MSVAAISWAALAVVFFVNSCLSLLDLDQDLRALTSTRSNGSLRLLLVVKERREWVRLVAFVLAFLAGAVNVFDLDFSGRSVVTIVGLFGSFIGLGLNGILERIDRVTLRRMIP